MFLRLNPCLFMLWFHLFTVCMSIPGLVWRYTQSGCPSPVDGYLGCILSVRMNVDELIETGLGSQDGRAQVLLVLLFSLAGAGFWEVLQKASFLGSLPPCERGHLNRCFFIQEKWKISLKNEGTILVCISWIRSPARACFSLAFYCCFRTLF